MNIFLACPTHDGRIDFRTADRIYETASQHHTLMIAINQSSLLNYNCNNLLAMALNKREQYGIKYFAMIHSDIIPEEFWLDKLVDIAEQHNTSLLSVVSPIKNMEGLTSTALWDDENKKYHNLKHDHIHHPDLTETFDSTDARVLLANHFPDDYDPDTEHLLVNTGCMLLSLDHVIQASGSFDVAVWFNTSDNLSRSRASMQFNAQVFPEDWQLSLDAARFLRGRVMATRAIKLQHVGQHLYSNY